MLHEKVKEIVTRACKGSQDEEWIEQLIEDLVLEIPLAASIDKMEGMLQHTVDMLALANDALAQISALNIHSNTLLEKKGLIIAGQQKPQFFLSQIVARDAINNMGEMRKIFKGEKENLQ